MGGRNKKKFIDKKRATTYTLVFRSTEDGIDAGPARELVESSRNVGIGRPDAMAIIAAGGARPSRYPVGHPLSFLEDLQVCWLFVTSLRLGRTDGMSSRENPGTFVAA